MATNSHLMSRVQQWRVTHDMEELI